MEQKKNVALPLKDPGPKTDKSELGGEVMCLHCMTRRHYLTAEHLATHGYTPEVYAKIFSAPPEVFCPPKTPNADVLQEVTNQAIDTIKKNSLSQIVDHVSNEFVKLFRDDIASSLADMLKTRVANRAKNIVNIERIRKELLQEWRITKGGHGGAPTSTSTLLSMLSALELSLKNDDEVIVKTAKLALEEEKIKNEAKNLVHPLDAVRANPSVEKLPDWLTPQERENARKFLETFKDSLAKHDARIRDDKVIDVTPVGAVKDAIVEVTQTINDKELDPKPRTLGDEEDVYDL